MLVSCGGGGNSGTPGVAAISVKAASPSISILTGDKFVATATDASGNVVPGVKFTWKSSAPGVAAIDSSTGLATGAAPGISQITASANGVTSPAVTITVLISTSASSIAGPSGTLVRLQGSGFLPTSTVTFGGHPAAPVAYLSPTQLVAIVPFATQSGALAPLPAGSYPIQVDSGPSVPYEITDFVANPNPPGTILNALAQNLGQIYSANRSAIQANLTTIQSISTNADLVSYATGTLALLPDLDTYVTNDLPNIASTLDAATLALVEQAIYSSIGYPFHPQSANATIRARQTAATPTTTSADQWLTSRFTSVQNTLVVVQGFGYANWVLLATCVLAPNPLIKVPACANGVVVGLLHSILELAVAASAGEVTELLLGSDQTSTRAGSIDVSLRPNASSQLSASIVVDTSLRVTTFVELFLKSIIDLNSPLPTTLAQKVGSFITSYTVDKLIAMLPGIPTASSQTYAFTTFTGFIRETPTFCRFSVGLPMSVTCADMVNVDPVSLLATAYYDPGPGVQDIVGWGFELDKKWLLPTEPGIDASAKFTVPPTSPSGIVHVAPYPLATAPDGGSVLFTATLVDSQGNLIRPQPTFSWQSGNPVATVAENGPNTALATIHASAPGTCAPITAKVVGDPNGNQGNSWIALAGSTSVYPCPP